MWVFTTFGFFSVAQKPGEEMLCVRARSAKDLDRLRQYHLPALGPIQENGGVDYPYRAWVHRAELALAMADIVRDLSYSSFQAAVSKDTGSTRSELYHQVWSTLHGIEQQHEDGPPPTAAEEHPPPTGKVLGYGGILLNGDRILLLRPTRDRDGYVWTFAGSEPEDLETAEQTALRAVRNGTGIEAEIIGELPGWYENAESATHFSLMRVVAVHGDWDEAMTQAIEWVALDEADAWIGTTRNAKGRARDLRVLEAVRAHGSGRLSPHTSWKLKRE